MTTATVAALLTILGYSLYDTIIVFDRVRENVPRMPRAAFSQIVNRSMSEVLTRSLATSFCTLLPVIALLLFGGETLKDFAFALMIGIASGAYSSIFIASPVLTHWKEREPAYRARRARIVARTRSGARPTRRPPGGAPEDVEPEQKQRRTRRGRDAPEAPGEQISREEFQDLVRDLGVEAEPAGAAQAAGAAEPRGARPPTAPPPAPPSATPPPTCHRRTSSSRTIRKPGRRAAVRATNATGGPDDRQLRRTGGRSLMGMLGWVMMGLAIWHLHDLHARPLLGRDRRGVRRLAARRGHLRAAGLRHQVSELRIPGEKATDIAVVLYAVPGALIGIAIVYLEGMRRERVLGARPLASE